MTPSPSRTASTLALVLLAAALAACGGPAVPVEVGTAVPTFDLENVAGGRLSSRDLAGKPAVINFWATWCRPCLKDLPELNALAEDGDVRVVAIALDETGRRAVEPFLAEHELRAAVLLGDQEVFQRFNGYAIPYTLAIDSQQKIRAIYRGPVTAEKIRAALRP